MYEVLNKSTYWPINSRKANNSRTHQLINLLTQKLKSLSFILQYHSNFLSVLEKIQVKKQVKSHFFYPFMSWYLSIFKPTTCILHHFAFLVWSPARNFSSPKNHFQPPKPHFLISISPFLALFFMAFKGIIYTIAVYFYAFYLAFSTILHRNQHHFTLHLASKRTAFCTKMHCNQHQNALHLAAYCTTFA